MDKLPVLDWVSRHDERSRSFPIRGAVKNVKYRDKIWKYGSIIDQGEEGRCVGCGWTAEALSTPVRVDLNRVKADIPRDPDSFARFLYNKAKTLDIWQGESYEGTSVIAGAKAMQSLNLLVEYRWAFSIEDIILALMNTGPVVLGMDWLDGMYEAHNGVLKPLGRYVGGHCITAIGYKNASPLLDGKPGIILQNSWGTEWGDNGIAIIELTDLYYLLSREGEACVPFRRKYGRK